MQIKLSDKYLGQTFQSDLATSALATVKDRQGKIKGATIEIRSIIEDYQMQAMGGLTAAWELWERALIPSLMSGAGTWLGDIAAAIKLCNEIQNFYWRSILKVPESCPKLSLLCEPNMTDFKWRVWEQKCLLLTQIKNLPDGSLAKIIQQEAELQGWPGLGREVKQICTNIGIPNINNHAVLKRDIQKAIKISHYDHMMGQFEGSKKLQDIKNDNFHQTQEYFKDKNLNNARMKFKIRTQMLEKIPGNFKSLYKSQVDGLKCNLCIEEMTQNHCKTCPERTSLRENLNLNSLDDLVIYFKHILSEKTLK